MSSYQAFDVPVSGGALRVGRWRSDVEGPLVLAAHGVTANHLAWSALASQTDLDLVAPDLRGRGRSAALEAPAGMDAHATDLLAVLDHLAVERAVLLGHSMGGFVVTALAAAHPDRTAGVLLVDGGLPLPEPPPGVTADEVLSATIGPAADRLRMTFADADAYRDFWRGHPALGQAWSAELEAYFDYDLVGDPPRCRSSVALAAVHDDSVDLLDRDAVVRRVHALPDGTIFLRAVDGMLGEPGGLYPASLAGEHAETFPQVQVRDVEGVNHYTVVMGERGAGVVAATLAEVSETGRL